MTIQSADIQIKASAVMADVPEGGGGPSGTTVEDGKSNQIFLDVSELDRAGGNVSIRQLHMQVSTPDTDTLMGSNIIVSRVPTDPNVSVTLAECDAFAVRTQIAEAIANYLIRASEWQGYLLENHVQGQRTITIFTRPTAPEPTIGRTLALVMNEGASNEVIQYVRVTDVNSSIQTFSYTLGGNIIDYEAKVLVCEISDALRSPFTGSPPSRLFQREAVKTIIRDTQVADAALFYGASPLTAVAALGSRSVKVGSIYSSLVPSSRTEVAALDQRPSHTRTLRLASAVREIDVAVAPHTRRIKIGQENRQYTYVAQLLPKPAPGTIGGSFFVLGNRYDFQDDGAGEITGAATGTVNYATGSMALTLPAYPDAGTSIVIAFGEATSFTDRSGQTAGVRAPEYAFNLHIDGGIIPGSVAFSWTSGGVVRTATASSAGVISGDATGRVDHPTGDVYICLAHMIDAGGQIHCEFQRADVETEIFSGVSVGAGGFATLQLQDGVPMAGSVCVRWATAQQVSETSGGALASTASEKSTDTATAALARSGGGITSIWSGVTGGYLMGGPGGIRPGAGSYSDGASTVDAEGRPVVRTTVTGSASSYTRESEATSETTAVVLHTLTDDAVGGFVGGMGTVDYPDGEISVKLASFGRSTTSYKADHEDASEFERTLTGDGTSSLDANTQKGGEWGSTSVGDALLDGSSVVVTYRTSAAPAMSESFTYTPADVVIDLAPYTQDRIVPGSVQFTWMGTTYRDVEGVLYREWTGSSLGIVSGAVDYAAGLAHMSDYTVSGSPSAFTLDCLFTQKGDWRTASVYMQTQALPVAPGGLTLFVLDVAGTQLTAVADMNGQITGAHVRGYLEHAYGNADLQFGDWVLDSTLTPAQKAEWWYSAADVGAVEPGKIWRPWPVDPGSLRYNAVTFSYLPIDADILGLDPVRLPADGRVPIFRRGGYVVIGHTGTTAATTAINATPIDLGRERLSRVRVIGADGATIDEGYAVDLDAGTVTPTDVTGWSQPVTIEHRVEQMLRVADVQIDGTVTLTGQLSHDYPAGSVLSSALVGGNLQARVARTFDQATWNGTAWKDAVEGNPATASYNTGLYPIEVTNDGAVTERWALRILSNSTLFECIGEHSGNIGQGSRLTDFAPVNPRTGQPYFTLAADGWGDGWVAGNVLFVHTVGASLPFAAIRTVQPSSPVSPDYHFELTARGDVDRAPGAND